MNGNGGVDEKTYERALQRAIDGGYYIGVWTSDEQGNRTWSVTCRGKGGWYTVRQDAGAHVTTCNCEAGRQGIYCKHRALVHCERVRKLRKEERERFAEMVARQNASVPAFFLKGRR